MPVYLVTHEILTENPADLILSASFTTDFMRSVKVHPTNSIRFTKEASFWCQMINLYKKTYPTHSFRQIARHFNMSETNARRYYYGIHHAIKWKKGYTQIREGACVTL